MTVTGLLPKVNLLLVKRSKWWYLWMNNNFLQQGKGIERNPKSRNPKMFTYEKYKILCMMLN